MFSDKEIERYSRNFLISSWGAKTHNALLKSSIYIDSFNEACAKYLIGAGVRNINIQNISRPQIELLKAFDSEVKINSTELNDLNTNLFTVGIFFKRPKFDISPSIELCKTKITLIIKNKEALNLPINSKFDLSEVATGINTALLAIKYMTQTS